MHPLQQPKEQPADDALVDCPGCPKCEPHGGLILKKGSGRPTAAWEHIWVFSKSGDYFWDDTAVKTATGASLRNYWVLGPEPLKDAHYASFPSAIPRTAISAGTSEKGACPACGAPWVRVTEKGAVRASDGRDRYGAYVYEPRDRMVQGDHCRSGPSGTAALPRREHKLLGWSPSCSCPPAEPRPCVVLDPFLGSGTTLLAADRLGRSGVGIELSPTYAAMARKRIESDAPMVSEPVEVVPAGDQLDLFSEATA